MSNGSSTAAMMLEEAIGSHPRMAEATETSEVVQPAKARRGRLVSWMTAVAAALYPVRVVEAVSVLYDTAKWKVTVIGAYIAPSVGVHRIVNKTGTQIFIQKIDGIQHTLAPGQAWSSAEKVVEPAHAGRLPIVELRWPDSFPAARVEIVTRIYQEGEIRVRQDEICLSETPVSAFDEMLAEQQEQAS